MSLICGCDDFDAEPGDTVHINASGYGVYSAKQGKQWKLLYKLLPKYTGQLQRCERSGQ